jgi:hypothetical protein
VVEKEHLHRHTLLLLGKEEEMSKKRKRRKVARDKKLDVQNKYLEGLTGRKRTARANLIKKMDKLYKSGRRIPRSLFKARVK